MNEPAPEELQTGLAELRSRDVSHLQKWLDEVRKYIDELKCEKWIDDAASRVSDLPSPEDLQELIKLVGEASLFSEEGTYHQLAVLYVPRKVGELVLAGFVRCSWTPDEPTNSSSLAKLAPLCIPYQTYLLLERHSSKSGFTCWGLADLTTRLERLTNDSMFNPDPKEKEDAKFRFPQLDLAQEPEALWLHSLHPGHVEGGWRDRFISLTEGDFVLWKVPAVSNRAKEWAEEEGWGRTLCGCYRAYLFTFFLEHVIGAMIMKGVGGTLLLALDPIKGEDNWHGQLDLKRNELRDKTRSSSPSICDRITECVKKFVLKELPADAPPHLVFPFLPERKLPHHLRALSSFIANLTSVDGATILDGRFEVLGFGEKIEADLQEEDLKSLVTNEAWKFSGSHGSRHQSAIRWVAAGKEKEQVRRVAIVASSDRKARVIFWQNCDEQNTPRQVDIHQVVYRRT